MILTNHYGISRVHFPLNQLFSFQVLHCSGNFFQGEMFQNCHQDLSIDLYRQLLFLQILLFVNHSSHPRLYSEIKINLVHPITRQSCETTRIGH